MLANINVLAYDAALDGGPARARAEQVEAGLAHGHDDVALPQSPLRRGRAVGHLGDLRAAAGAVRSARLQPEAHQLAVRLRLPDRDLHAGGAAGPRLLRAALPAR